MRRRVPFRVTSRLSGKRNFRRLDLQRVIERALSERGWYLASSNAALDIWAEVHGDDGYISLKLSANDMAQRPYKQAHIPASLKPTLAYSMVRLSRPHPDDVFLDAMCVLVRSSWNVRLLVATVTSSVVMSPLKR